MSSYLDRIQNWPELARQANWSATSLAKLCGVSTETVRRHFLAKIGKSTRQWLVEERQRKGVALLRNGSSIKETAVRLGYKQQTNFTRKFKEYWGVCPSLSCPPRRFVGK
jgi:AraC-like DNA-binding protein